MEEQILRQFISAINAHDIEQISALITDDHTFIDSHNNTVTGRDKMRSGWKLYFDLFPDYHIEIEKIFRNGNELAAFGFAEGTYHNLQVDMAKAHWRLPASWRAIVSNKKIALWQVYADTMIPFEIINRYSPAGGEADKVTGIGGVFFKSVDPKTLCKWYDEHLGTQFGENEYTLFHWRDRSNKERIGSTTFSAFKEATDYFEPSAKEFMFNFRVNNLDALLERLRKEGIQVFDKTDTYDFGKFGWIMDPEGNKIELWQPMNEELFG